MSKWRRFRKKALEIELIVGAVIAILVSIAALIPGSIICCGIEFIKDRIRTPQRKGVT